MASGLVADNDSSNGNESQPNTEKDFLNQLNSDLEAESFSDLNTELGPIVERLKVIVPALEAEMEGISTELENIVNPSGVVDEVDDDSNDPLYDIADIDRTKLFNLIPRINTALERYNRLFILLGPDGKLSHFSLGNRISSLRRSALDNTKQNLDSVEKYRKVLEQMWEKIEATYSPTGQKAEEFYDLLTENIKGIKKVVRAKPKREFIGHNYSGDTFTVILK